MSSSSSSWDSVNPMKALQDAQIQVAKDTVKSFIEKRDGEKVLGKERAIRLQSLGEDFVEKAADIWRHGVGEEMVDALRVAAINQIARYQKMDGKDQVILTKFQNVLGGIPDARHSLGMLPEEKPLSHMDMILMGQFIIKMVTPFLVKSGFAASAITQFTDMMLTTIPGLMMWWKWAAPDAKKAIIMHELKNIYRDMSVHIRGFLSILLVKIPELRDHMKTLDKFVLTFDDMIIPEDEDQ